MQRFGRKYKEDIYYQGPQFWQIHKKKKIDESKRKSSLRTRFLN